jgi:TetR/AcrR family transcriptional regulator, mexJK operon transcriptional repressor
MKAAAQAAPPPACRERLVRAASEVFREEGYRASIDVIAARAGVARQTIYNHFASKEDLFREVANMAASSVLVSLDGDARDLRERLLRFGTVFRQKLLGDEGLALYRTVFAEAPRFPELARTFFENGPGQTIRRVAEFLERAMDEGQLRREDPTYAAETLLSMLDCWDRSRRLFGTPPPPAAAERARVARIVDCYLRAFAPAMDRKNP